jgi:4-hydroxybenzoyl-CoA thioesterase
MSISKVILHSVNVEFGDCDPAGIVWFPNFFRWIDAASRNFFIQCGVPPWHETEKTLGVFGTPLVDTHSKFVKTASYGDVLQLHVSITEWREKSFVRGGPHLRGAPHGRQEWHPCCSDPARNPIPVHLMPAGGLGTPFACVPEQQLPGTHHDAQLHPHSGRPQPPYCASDAHGRRRQSGLARFCQLA